MMLRLILVGLVTSMGLELPSGRDVSSWAESGRAWANANLVNLSAPGVEVIPVTEPVPACLPTPADLAFQAVQGEMAAELGADRTPIAEDDAAIIAGCDAVAADVLSSVTVGLPAGEELATAVPVDPTVEPGSVAMTDELAEGVEDDEDAPSRTERLASALRLTREAAQAWSAVLVEPADEVGSTR